MSQLRFVAKVQPSNDVLEIFHAVTGRSRVQLKSAAKTGAPLAEFQLFKKDHDDVVKDVRLLMSKCDEEGFAVYECVTDPSTREERCHLSSFQIVENILRESDQIARDLEV